MLGEATPDPRKAVEVADLATLFNYPKTLRSWGMRITLIDTGISYILVKGLVDTDKSNNANFQTEQAFISSLGFGNFPPGSTFSGTLVQLSIPISGGGTGFSLKNGNNKLFEYLALTKAAYGGGATTDAILSAVNIPNGSTIKVTAEVIATQVSGTVGATGFSYKVVATFRKTAGGVLSIVGASVQSEVVNDTGDAFNGTPNLNVAAGTVSLTQDLTTAKQFNISVWVSLKINQ